MYNNGQGKKTNSEIGKDGHYEGIVNQTTTKSTENLHPQIYNWLFLPPPSPP